jgi:hypothetical protein
LCSKVTYVRVNVLSPAAADLIPAGHHPTSIEVLQEPVPLPWRSTVYIRAAALLSGAALAQRSWGEGAGWVMSRELRPYQTARRCLHSFIVPGQLRLCHRVHSCRYVSVLWVDGIMPRHRNTAVHGAQCVSTCMRQNLVHRPARRSLLACDKLQITNQLCAAGARQCAR